jgi:hypothetical protein
VLLLDCMGCDDVGVRWECRGSGGEGYVRMIYNGSEIEKGEPGPNEKEKEKEKERAQRLSLETASVFCHAARTIAPL